MSGAEDDRDPRLERAERDARTRPAQHVADLVIEERVGERRVTATRRRRWGSTSG